MGYEIYGYQEDCGYQFHLCTTGELADEIATITSEEEEHLTVDEFKKVFSIITQSKVRRAYEAELELKKVLDNE